jgi:hypothetical protein
LRILDELIDPGVHPFVSQAIRKCVHALGPATREIRGGEAAESLSCASPGI